MNKMNPTNATARPTVSFLDLPLELRRIIYRHAIVSQDLTFRSQPVDLSAADTQRGDPFYLPWLEQVCRVNEATRIEVSLYLLPIVEFSLLYLEQVRRFGKFLESLGCSKQGFAAVRKLDFQLFGRNRPSAGNDNVYIELMKQCTKLTQVRLKFEVEHMRADSCNWAEDVVMPPTELRASDQIHIRETDDVIAIYRLADLLKLEKLNRLTIEAWPRIRVSDRDGMQDVLVDCTPLMERLAQWLREGFRHLDRNVDVTYVEASSPGLRWSRRI